MSLEDYEWPHEKNLQLHCQKDDIMFLFQKNILAAAIKLPQKIYHLQEEEKRNIKTLTLCFR